MVFPPPSTQFGDTRRLIMSGRAWAKSACLSPSDAELSIMKRRSTLSTALARMGVPTEPTPDEPLPPLLLPAPLLPPLPLPAPPLAPLLLPAPPLAPTPPPLLPLPALAPALPPPSADGARWPPQARGSETNATTMSANPAFIETLQVMRPRLERGAVPLPTRAIFNQPYDHNTRRPSLVCPLPYWMARRRRRELRVYEALRQLGALAAPQRTR